MSGPTGCHRSNAGSWTSSLPVASADGTQLPSTDLPDIDGVHLTLSWLRYLSDLNSR
jgi:hypothetical protein